MPNKTLSEERFKTFIQESVKYYSWENILRDAGITNVEDKGDQFEITCPLHEDKRPSMRLNKRTGVFHCFSCKAKGTYTKFLWLVAGKPIAYSLYCEQILKANLPMQRELRFNSLFVEDSTLDPEFNKRRVFNREVHLGSGLPLTSLVNKARALDDSWDTMCFSLTMLQQGVDTDSVLALLQKRVVKIATPETRINIMDII